ncbi:hypothetical protein MJO28_017272 [Puccinia striiformis f. sp. tritici]|nr:hypothetical protein MJO28_017272 [Puccinia striiformis f. sp. tritici]
MIKMRLIDNHHDRNHAHSQARTVCSMIPKGFHIAMIGIVRGQASGHHEFDTTIYGKAGWTS